MMLSSKLTRMSSPGLLSLTLPLLGPPLEVRLRVVSWLPPPGGLTKAEWSWMKFSFVDLFLPLDSPELTPWAITGVVELIEMTESLKMLCLALPSPFPEVFLLIDLSLPSPLRFYEKLLKR